MAFSPSSDDSLGAHLRAFVVAATAERAMAVVRERYPDCVFHKVDRRDALYGHDSVLVDAPPPPQ